MTKGNRGKRTESDKSIELRQPLLAAFLGWLIPGAGHLYQGRYGKGVLFMVCILTTYFFGLAMGGGHVVYASWKLNDKRWQYFCQLGVGLPALPAIAQSRRFDAGRPLLMGGIMAPPSVKRIGENPDELAKWHRNYNSLFDLGTVYTMIAGLLNVLAVYDALSGPALAEQDSDEKKPPPDAKKSDA